MPNLRAELYRNLQENLNGDAIDLSGIRFGETPLPGPIGNVSNVAVSADGQRMTARLHVPEELLAELERPVASVGFRPLSHAQRNLDYADSIDASRLATFQNGAFPQMVLVGPPAVPDINESWIEDNIRITREHVRRVAEGISATVRRVLDGAESRGPVLIPGQINVRPDLAEPAAVAAENFCGGECFKDY